MSPKYLFALYYPNSRNYFILLFNLEKLVLIAIFDINLYTTKIDNSWHQIEFQNIYFISGVLVTIPDTYDKNGLPNETLTEVNIGKELLFKETLILHQFTKFLSHLEIVKDITKENFTLIN